MSLKSTILGASALVSSLAFMSIAAPAALAQDASANLPQARDTITVTARRREESIQDAPIAVTAVSGDTLAQIGAIDLTDVQKLTPNATIEVARGSNSTLIAFIRGVGQQDPLWGFEPGVGLYIDDVYVARPQGAVLDIFDIDRIEVLRGPQGTLYGRNTIGGAIKYVTARLSDEPEFEAGVSVGSYNQLDYMASGSLPLSDTFAIGGAVARYTRDGFGENLYSGADHYNKDIIAGRISAEWTPTDDLFFRLAYDRTEDDSNAKHGYRLIPGVTNGEPVLDDVYDTRGGAGDVNSVETEGLSLTAEWQANDWLTLKSITAGREDYTQTPIDFDALPVNDFDVPAFYENEQFTQEFQALFDTGRWSGVAGLYYLNGAYEGAFDTVLGNLGVNAPTYGDVSKISLSAYADVTYDINDMWSVSLGGRYTEDTTRATVIRQTYLGTATTPFLGGPGGLLLATGSNFTSERTDDQFSPRVNVTYEPLEDLSLYASYSQGFKSGGFDPRGNAGPAGTVQYDVITRGFDPEIVDSYEIGAKGSLLDGRLVYRAAAFYAEYTDQQITVQTSEVDPATGLDSFVSTVLNAGESEYMGVELEGSAFLTDALSLDYMIGFIDAEIVELVTTQPDPVTGDPVDVDISDQYVVQNTPEYTWRLAANYDMAVPGGYGDLRLTAGVSYRDDINLFNVPNTGEPVALAGLPGTPLPPLDENTSYTMVDASVIWDFTENWRFSLIGRNLTDEEYRVAGYNFAGSNQLGVDGAYSAFYGDPRTITASVRFTY
ncbi:TonB-dependent receptor [Marinicauda sp. Alg238-R41]|uniref:TonB-dependent receptor n=1 Tax=Marinicauda sp. Alg238-R41 TaxID=2993447 RepID=UPI0022E0D8E2|nr:TonB-dependent receptor [Marinicauda sp. Alg238-R41]